MGQPFDPDPEQLDAADIARALERSIRARFGIRPDVPEIKRADRALLASERRAFSDEAWDWPELEGVEPLEIELVAWSPDDAAREFNDRYEELERRRRLAT